MLLTAKVNIFIDVFNCPHIHWTVALQTIMPRDGNGPGLKRTYLAQPARLGAGLVVVGFWLGVGFWALTLVNSGWVWVRVLVLLD